MNKKVKKIIHSKLFVIILTVILILSIGFVGTYAWLTWSSPENTTLTMTIGDLTDVTFINGNDINTSLTPVFNYSDGEKTTFTINHKGLSSNVVGHTVTLNITTIPEELRNESLKYKLVSSNNYVTEGDFSSAADNSSITLVDNLGLESGVTEYTFYLYIDSNIENNSNMMNKNIVGNITFTANELESTPLSDFEYSIGSWDSVGDGSQIIEIPEGRILLSRYIGTDSTVNVSSVYVVDGVEYVPIVYGDDIFYMSDPTLEATFMYNSNITEVNFAPGVLFADLTDNASLTYNSLSYLLAGCSSLVRVTGFPETIERMDATFMQCSSLTVLPNISSNVTSLYSTFNGCLSLINFPVIPDSVTNLSITFGRTNLVIAPDIPNSVVDMTGTFQNCVNLIVAPEIPNSVVDMYGTFIGCTSLVTAPEIPSSVTNMTLTFFGCTNLEGTVRINSSNVAAFTGYPYHAFCNTGKEITVEVPSGSTTYDSLNNYKPSNITVTTY